MSPLTGAHSYLIYMPFPYATPLVDSITTGDTIEGVTLGLDSSGMPISDVSLSTSQSSGVGLSYDTTRAKSGLTSDPLTYRAVSATLNARYFKRPVKLFL